MRKRKGGVRRTHGYVRRPPVIDRESMQSLEQYLRQFFGDARRGDRRVAASDAHAVYEAGFDVSYSRYAVTYRDARGTVVVAAEFDDEGELLVHYSRCPDALAAERIDGALDFLGVKHLRG